MSSPYDLVKILPHIVDGKAVSTPGGMGSESVISIDPFSGEELWSASGASSSVVDEAVSAARRAFPSWSARTFDERQGIVSRFVEEIKLDAEPLAEMIAIEGGKPLWEAKGEVNSLITKFAASVEAYRLRNSEMSREVRGMRSYTRFLPHGVMAVLGPFNFPASMANSHIMPGLLAGNTVVFKPSELTPITGLLVSQAWQRAGLPHGVLNCVTGGRSTGEALTTNSGVDGVLFVGSHPAGLSILRGLVDSPEKIVALEMGGNSPLVVWDYDDIDVAVHIILQSTYMSGGQRCSAARRLFLRNGDVKLLARLIDVLSALQIGHYGDSPEPYYGPLIRPKAAKAVMTRFDELRDGGGKTLLSPRVLSQFGTLVTPGLIDVTECTADRDEEIFGPVLKVYSYDSLEDAIAVANRTRFGLASGIICRDRGVYERFFHSVKAGIVNWNQQLTGATTFAPFGGVKQSGNFRPAGFLSADYCSYSVASFEVDTPRLPDALSPGIHFE